MREFNRRDLLTLTTLAMLLVPIRVAWAWEADEDCTQTGGYLRFDPTDSIEVRLDPGDADPQTGDPVAWTAHEKSIIRIMLGTYNHLPNARLHFELTSTTCDKDSTPTSGTVCLWKRKDAGGGGSSTMWYSSSSCEISKCRIFANEGGASNDDELYFILVHEFAHCLGLDHVANDYDWMHASYSDPFGGSGEHMGMTRDIRNAMSYLYPFGHNFFFGHFDDRWYYGEKDSHGYTDVMVRKAKTTNNTIGWYLNSRYEDDGSYGFTDEGEESDDGDFGDEHTLPYVVGDFTGSGHDDIAAGLCSSPDPGDGLGDTITWYVMESTQTYQLGFNTTNIWKTDFGNAEDFDMYFSGNFTGDDDCDDLLLIRNLSDYDCDADNDECQVRLYVLPAEDDDTPGDGECDSFGSFYYLDIVVSERSATTAWPWVVGDFYTRDGLGCADIAFGQTDQSDPTTINWYVVKGTSTDRDDACEDLELISTAWTGDMGDMGQLLWFAGDFGAPNSTVGQDLVRVKVKDTAVEWYVAYSDGVDDFTNGSTVLTDMQMYNDDYWRAMIFGVGNFYGSTGSNDDFITLVDLDGSARLTPYIGRNDGGTPTSSWSEQAGSMLPNSEAVWDQATDWDDWNTTKDNGGDDVRYDWWCKTCDEWYNDTN